MSHIVRSLWGGDTLQFAKICRDVAFAPVMPSQTVVAFDHHAEACLRYLGVRFVSYDGDRPPIYKGLSSCWWKKLAAVRQVMAATGNDAVHLDFDTIVRHGVPWKHLRRGPRFSGRLRYYKRSQHNGRGEFNTHVYHGGCFYVRDMHTIDEALAIHAGHCPTHTDEVALTILADRIVGSADPADHRASGCDNPELYSTGRNVLAAQQSAAFREGHVIRPGKFMRSLLVAFSAEARKRRRAAIPRLPRGSPRDQFSMQRRIVDGCD